MHQKVSSKIGDIAHFPCPLATALLRSVRMLPSQNVFHVLTAFISLCRILNWVLRGVAGIPFFSSAATPLPPR